MTKRFAILLDGGFVTKVLHFRNKSFPTSVEVEAECQRVIKSPHLAGYDLLRIYFYDAPPATGIVKNPIDGSELDLAKTKVFTSHESLLDKLELSPNFAVRRGEVLTRGWKLGKAALLELTKKPRPLGPRDFVPNIVQKGVDLRIGLDISRLALRDMVSAIVIVSGDSDLVPAFKFARREGVRIYLDHMGSSIRRDLKAHADIVL
jgi:uncharacterized LabA/DUF88 family protein